MRYLYRYAGVRRVESARRHLDDVLAGWSVDWRVAHASAPMRVDWQVADADCVERFSGEEPTALQRVDDTLFLRATDAAWRRALFGSAAAQLPDDALAVALLGRARVALVTALSGGHAHAAPADADTQANAQANARKTATQQIPAAGRAWLHAGILVADNDAPCLELLLDARRFDAVLATRPPVALTPRAQAVRNARLPLTLQLPLDSVSAHDLRHLRPGVIVQSRQRLDEPLLLGSATQASVLRAFLGQRDGRLAVRIDGIAGANATATISASPPSSTPETARR
jgi:hypothetical protein